jgi:hypothetical protein
MLGARSWLALALGAALLSPGLGTPADETPADPEAELSVPLRRDPSLVWKDILVVRDDIYHYTDEEDLEEVAELAAELNQLKREFHLGVLQRMDLSSPAQRRDPARAEEVRTFSEIKVALNFIYVASSELQTAAATGIPGHVRAVFPRLDQSIAVVQQWVPEWLLTGAPRPVRSASSPSS